MTQMLMKGYTFEKACTLVRGKPRFSYPIWVEPKVDEIRCRVLLNQAGDIEFRSFAEKPLYNLEDFATAFYQFMDFNGLYELDVGVEVNGNYGDSYRWVSSSRNRPADLHSGMVNFFLYDLPNEGTPYEERRAAITQILSRPVPLCLRISQLDAVLCHSKEEVHAEYDRLRGLGYEGAMGKVYGHMYSRKRSFDWMKLKPENDSDGVIVELIEAVAQEDQPERDVYKGDLLGRIGSVRVRCEDDSIATPHGIKHDLGIHMLQNPEAYLGKWCEFKFMERDRQGGYRHPTFNRIREDKA